jgi:hypothetical protein
MVKLFACVVVTASLLVGCAGTTVRRIQAKDPGQSTGTPNGDVEDDAAEGIKYYETAPFLLVYSDGKGSSPNPTPSPAHWPTRPPM